jgi:CBS domain-containing protein
MTSIARVRRVADLMTRDPITIRDIAPLDEARRRLQAAHISGLPVTDAAGQVVGVISQSDLVALGPCLDDGPVPRGGHTVANAMARPAITIGSWAPLRAAARLLRDYRVHRIVVVDEEQRAVGILSSMDFVGIVADSPEFGQA